MHSYVVEGEGKRITDLLSYYTLPSTVIGNDQYDSLQARAMHPRCWCRQPVAPLTSQRAPSASRAPHPTTPPTSPPPSLACLCLLRASTACVSECAYRPVSCATNPRAPSPTQCCRCWQATTRWCCCQSTSPPLAPSGGEGGGGRGQLARWAPTLHARTASLRTHSPTLPLNPHAARSKSQIQTYLEQNEGPGLQHLALKTDNVFRTVRAMRERWVGSWVGC